jgi:hypothetical protein
MPENGSDGAVPISGDGDYHSFARLLRRCASISKESAAREREADEPLSAENAYV